MIDSTDTFMTRERFTREAATLLRHIAAELKEVRDVLEEHKWAVLDSNYMATVVADSHSHNKLFTLATYAILQLIAEEAEADARAPNRVKPKWRQPPPLLQVNDREQGDKG